MHGGPKTGKVIIYTCLVDCTWYLLDNLRHGHILGVERMAHFFVIEHQLATALVA